jgi:hypothetical protein
MIYTPFKKKLGYSLKYTIPNNEDPINIPVSKEVQDIPKIDSFEDFKTNEEDISTEITFNNPGITNFKHWYDKSGISKKRFKFFAKLAEAESGFNPTIKNSAGYPAWGYFQFMDGSFTDSNGRTRTWSNIKDIAEVDVKTFLNNPDLQIKSADKLADKFLSSFSKKDFDRAKALGYSDSALVAGAWLAGAGGVKNFLHKGHNAKDVHGTNVAQRMQEFNNYFEDGGIIKFDHGGKEDVLKELELNKDHVRNLYPWLLGNLSYTISRKRVENAKIGYTDTIPDRGRYYPLPNFVQINNEYKDDPSVEFHEVFHSIDSIYANQLKKNLKRSGGLKYEDGSDASDLDLSEVVTHLATAVNSLGVDAKNMSFSERSNLIDLLKDKATKSSTATLKTENGPFRTITKYSDGTMYSDWKVEDGNTLDHTFSREYDDSIHPYIKLSRGDLRKVLDVLYGPAKFDK